jgi:hypothetical protein
MPVRPDAVRPVLTVGEEARLAYDRDGFCRVAAVFPDAEVGQMHSLALALLREVEAGRDLPCIARFGHDVTQVRDILRINQIDRAFEDVMNDARLVTIAGELLGSDVVDPLWLHLRNSIPGFGGLSVHCDSLGCSQDPSACLSMWIALGDYAVEDGCLFYLAGSHRESPPPTKPTPVAVDAGDVVCHGWQTQHGSLPNRRCRRRLALMACYQSRQDG